MWCGVVWCGVVCRGGEVHQNSTKKIVPACAGAALTRSRAASGSVGTWRGDRRRVGMGRGGIRASTNRSQCCCVARACSTSCRNNALNSSLCDKHGGFREINLRNGVSLLLYVPPRGIYQWKEPAHTNRLDIFYCALWRAQELPHRARTIISQTTYCTHNIGIKLSV